MEANLGSRVGMVEGTSGSPKNLLVSRTLVETTNKIPIKVANLHISEVTVNECDVLGVCRLIQKVVASED